MFCAPQWRTQDLYAFRNVSVHRVRPSTAAISHILSHGSAVLLIHDDNHHDHQLRRGIPFDLLRGRFSMDGGQWTHGPVRRPVRGPCSARRSRSATVTCPRITCPRDGPWLSPRDETITSPPAPPTTLHLTGAQCPNGLRFVRPRTRFVLSKRYSQNLKFLAISSTAYAPGSLKEILKKKE